MNLHDLAILEAAARLVTALYYIAAATASVAVSVLLLAIVEIRRR